MQFLSVFINITKIADFRRKIFDITRTQGLCHVIDIYFGSSLDKISLSSFITVESVEQFLGRDFFAHPIRNQPRKDPS